MDAVVRSAALCLPGENPASKVREAISVLFGSQVSLRFTTVREIKYTSQQGRNQRGAIGQLPPQNFHKHMYLYCAATSYIILPPPKISVGCGHASQQSCDKTVDGKMALYRECCFPNCTKSRWLKIFLSVLKGHDSPNRPLDSRLVYTTSKHLA